ncbi:carboxymuconolactone decarboxylase family protein [Primorskyibacter sp. S87]|uniref:carboxymuconolactone decarboxylase family protein n=1 Tax=Primorskyibacter sp. S87 TaxID=3415126 RepID=UPI003C7E1B9C
MKRLFPSLPDNPRLGHVFQKFPATVRPLLEFHDLALRADSALSVAERELIAAYVSGLNSCAFCHGAHVAMAQAFGVDPATIEALLTDVKTAPVDDRLKPLLAYVAKLTHAPSRMTEADAEAVYAAGWSEQALFDAVQTCAIFNMMNRIVEGTGVATYPSEAGGDMSQAEIERLQSRSYMDFGREIGVVPPR